MDPVPADALVMRPMSRDDLGSVAGLARDQGRNATPQEYERFLRLEGARAFVVERHGALVGAATAMRYYEHGFLGPLLLAPGHDPAGIAVALLAQLVETIQTEGVHVIDAEAAQAEEAILQRMGFQRVRGTLVMERPGAASRGLAGSVPMEEHHLLDVGALDAGVVGYGRKQYIAALRAECPDGARVVESQDGDIAGFVLLRRAARGFHLGPLVTQGRDAAAARALVRDAVAAAAGAAVVALVPDGSEARDLLRAEGFAEVGTLSRMRAGAVPAPGGDAGSTEWVLGGRITG